MIPVFQTLTTANDGRGNCFAACLASIMERSLRDLPNVANDLNGAAFFGELERWLVPQGLFINRHESGLPKGWSIAGGRLKTSGGDIAHAVVAFNGVPVHDPYPLQGQFGGIEEYYTIDPITEAQRPYCDELLSSAGNRQCR